MKIDLKPISTRVIILPDELPDKTESGIYLPKSSHAEFIPTEGRVIACGDECIYVRENDKVYYGKYSGFRFTRKIDGKDVMLVGMNEEDILFKVEEDE